MIGKTCSDLLCGYKITLCLWACFFGRIRKLHGENVSIHMFGLRIRQVTWTEKPWMYRWFLIVHGKTWCWSKDPTDSFRNHKSVPCHGSATGIPNILGHIIIHELTLGFSIHHFGDVPITIAIAIILFGGFSNQSPNIIFRICQKDPWFGIYPKEYYVTSTTLQPWFYNPLIYIYIYIIYYIYYNKKKYSHNIYIVI